MTVSAESSVRTVPTAEFHIPGLHAALDEVAKERRYLAFLGAPPFAATREFSRALTSGAGVQLVAPRLRQDAPPSRRRQSKNCSC